MRLAADLAVRPRLGEIAAIWFLLHTVDDVVKQSSFPLYNDEATITSGTDGVHMKNSLHYKGHAFDFRTRDMGRERLAAVTAALKARLGPDYDVIQEVDHLHVEWDPKA